MTMNTIDRSKAAFVAACFAALALLPWLAGSYGVDLVTKIMVYAVFALSLELLVGATGLVCFGQAAFFGIGAYAAVLLSPASEPQPSWGEILRQNRLLIGIAGALLAVAILISVF